MQPSLADRFAAIEHEHFALYAALARTERNPEFRAILEQLVEHERGDFEFWRGHASRKAFALPVWKPLLYHALRGIFGLTFTVKLLERSEKDVEAEYAASLRSDLPVERAQVEELLAREAEHERMLIGLIHEEKVARIGNVLLGVNDGLIELTGALTGFTFAFTDTAVVAASGLITGIAATLSMASSAYMQAKYEPGKDPVAAAMTTGASYFVVVLALVSPYFLTNVPETALAAMLVFALTVIAVLSLYVSVVFERSFRRQFGEMALFSLGVAAVSYLLGTALQRLIA